MCCPRSRSAWTRGERVLITTLTKRMAEDLTEYLDEHGVKVRYLHSDIDTVERMEIIRDLRLGKFDVLVGINLLREGLDMPEVSLVAILDADKEGFLRSENSLIQTIGRAARHLNGRAILYADRCDRLDPARASTRPIDAGASSWSSTQQHGITPRGIKKGVADILEGAYSDAARAVAEGGRAGARTIRSLTPDQLIRRIKKLEQEMLKHARNLEFEQAARLRDEVHKLRNAAFGLPTRRPAEAGLIRLFPRALAAILAGLFQALSSAVEHLLDKQGVTGSIPVAPTTSHPYASHYPA